jgi:DNA ligase 1
MSNKSNFGSCSSGNINLKDIIFKIMDYSVLAETYEKLEKIPSKLKKTDILAELFEKTSANDLSRVVLLCQGMVYPKYQMMELGVAVQMMIRAIAKAAGFTVAQVEEKFKKTGDLGLTAEECIKSRKQSTLLKKKLTLDFVFDNLRKLATITGHGSQDRKLSMISELMVSANPKEARYITRTILQELRVGAAEGIIRNAIVKAFLKEDKKEAAAAVEYAWNIMTDFGEVAEIAKKNGMEGLKKVRVQIGRPIQVMLGEKVENFEAVMDEFGEVAIEKKYDGARIQIQKQGNKIWLFTRREEDVTRQFPDLVELCKRCLKPNECIVEGEMLAVNQSGSPLPFQVLSQRIQRKYDIERMAKEIPIQMNLFDVVFLEGKMLFGRQFKERREILEEITKVMPGKFQLSEQIITDNLKNAEKFYKKSLADKQEGVMIKVLDSIYVFGRHVGTMYKIKPVMETLDLVIIGATWGEGARTNWLTSYILACRDPDTGKLLECGMMSTGLTEEEYNEMTQRLKPLIVSEKGKTIKVKPEIVIEVGYEEIQKSKNYDSGFALRFPRFQRVRPEKGVEEADNIERVRELYKSQGNSG